MALCQSPWSGEWYGEPTADQWRRIHLDKEETWKRDGFDPAWFTGLIVSGHCPQCGAPIYMPRIWPQANPPPASYACECWRRVSKLPWDAQQKLRDHWREEAHTR